MSGFKDVMKGGWKPKGRAEGGGKESWRGDFKGVNTVAGWMGKVKGSNEEATSHQSAPLSTLKDPDSFGPPPKRVDHGGGQVPPRAPTSDRSGPPVPFRSDSTSRQRRQETDTDTDGEVNKSTPGPFKTDTTGLNTANLPKPPTSRRGPPLPPPATTTRSPPPTITTKAPPPRLPPRLPPRQNSHPDLHAPLPPPTYSESVREAAPEQGILNHGAMDRLGRAGVAIPAFGIGRASPPVLSRQPAPPSNTTQPPPASPRAGRGPQLSELQSRFTKMTPSPSDSEQTSTGTTWADKQAALKTVGNARNEPSKVSLPEMRNAALTANNFRERHGEQAVAGWRGANTLDQKHGVSDKVNGINAPVVAPAPSSPSSPSLNSPTQGAFGKKAPPPPPPKKKKELTANPSSPTEPPPIPFASKPKFN
ncbi:hypothetical protein B0J11DRAFT_549497 [Dendryphion nanum]|uniref:Uncharacterized protein n=1 Tax=Dendryphion nanum TaxID=256645 RepID=A0A9P9DYM9_9PLEO|nr:hypothetical protein B0J11DRAFT_549497 [Dendryphion nanum]